MEDITAFLNVAYLGAAILFILSLSGLAAQETARRGNVYGMVGMMIAIVATAVDPRVESFQLMAGALILGGLLGAHLAARVEMTKMPQLVAMLHSFVGLAAVMVGISSYLNPPSSAAAVSHVVHGVEIYADVLLGAITFTGSVVAWAKLDGRMSSKPTLLPARHVLNLVVVGLIIWIGVHFVHAEGTSGVGWLLLMAVIAGALGVHLVVAIGGADMPVVVSLLNSYSGWTAAAAGFMLSNDLLIVTGALVGSSGAILSYIMCKAMNRSIWSVVFGGFGANAGKTPPPPSDGAAPGEVTAVEVKDVVRLLEHAKSVVVVPGYGMAVAQAQHLVREFGELLQAKGVTVRFAIHPVAGRLPGHMNVLLAEAGVPYDIVFEMDEINDDMPETDVVLVIGANDIVNPGAQTDAHSPIYGMPVIEAWKAGTVVVLKRGMAAGYAGVGNPLFFRPNTRMLFGDAKDSMGRMVYGVRPK